jgi:hypothetical protein
MAHTEWVMASLSVRLRCDKNQRGMMAMQSTQKIDFAEQARTATAFLGSAFLGQRAEAFLKVEDDILAGAETVMCEWLHRRQEEVSDTQRLFARIRDSRDLSDIFKAQQDWMSGALRRLADDAESCQKVGLRFATAATREFGKAEQAMEADAQDAAREMGAGSKAAKGTME